MPLCIPLNLSSVSDPLAWRWVCIFVGHSWLCHGIITYLEMTITRIFTLRQKTKGFQSLFFLLV